MVGHHRVYIPAFERPNERRKLVEHTKDPGYRPRAGITPGLSCSSLTKTTMHEMLSSAKHNRKERTEPNNEISQPYDDNEEDQSSVKANYIVQ